MLRTAAGRGWAAALSSRAHAYTRTSSWRGCLSRRLLLGRQPPLLSPAPFARGLGAATDPPGDQDAGGKKQAEQAERKKAKLKLGNEIKKRQVAQVQHKKKAGDSKTSEAAGNEVCTAPATKSGGEEQRQAAATAEEESVNKQSREEKNKPRQPLPAIQRNNPEHEFTTRRQLHETRLQSFMRRNIAPMFKVTAEVSQLVASKETFYIVTGAGIILLTIGASEALLCLSTSVPKLSPEALHFVWSYSWKQLLPSFIWSTTPADLICHSIGLEASTMLRTFDQVVPYQETIFGGGTDGAWSVGDARRQLSLMSLQALRSLLAQSILLANVLNAVNRVVRVNGVIAQRVLDGCEPFPSGVQEKVIRFCGVKSDVSTVTLRYSADHLIPVFEDRAIGPFLSRRRMEELRDPTLASLAQQRQERRESRFDAYLYPQHQPMYWHVPAENYLSPWAWSNFNFDPDFFLRTTTGKRILYLEADATNEEDSLSLGRRARDLSINDASLGCWGIEQYVRSLPEIQSNTATKNFRVCRVFLGDLQQLHRTGGGLRLSVGLKLKYLKEFDVLIDSQLVVLAAILKWCQFATKDQDVESGRLKRIAFHTTNETFFSNLELLLECFGYELKDSVEVQHFEEARYEFKVKDPQQDGDGGGGGEEEEEEAPPLWVDTTIPHLVYHETSAESVMETKHLLSAGLVDPKLCCVLTDKFEIHQQIRDMVKRYPAASELTTICSPVLFDEELRAVREWTRMGHSAKEIQEEMDAEVEHLTDALSSYKLRQGLEKQKMLDEVEELAVTAAEAVVEAAKTPTLAP